MNKIKILSKLIIIFLFFQNFSSAETSQQVDKISKNLRCLICQGQSVYDSQSDFALSMKILIQNKIDEGKNDEQIYDFLKNKYGEWIVYKPPFSSSNLLLWTLPYIFLLIGAFFLIKIAINKKKFK